MSSPSLTMAEMPSPHSTAFSRKLPGMQTAWDSTSIGRLKTCPRKYYYSMIRGIAPRRQNDHLTFGLLLHSALEVYEKHRVTLPHDEAQERMVDWTLRESWEWKSETAEKTRKTLLRSIVWFTDKFNPDPLKTMILSDGRPATELSFQIPLSSHVKTTDEELILCGHIDRMVLLDGRPYANDKKTTKGQLGNKFFSTFSPNNQMSLYIFAGQVAFAVELQGMIIDGIQVGVGFTRFERQLVSRDKFQINEWYQGLKSWLQQAEMFALLGNHLQQSGQAIENAWPQNDTACDHYGGCEFRSLCSKTPGAREREIGLAFSPSLWNPLTPRT